MAKRIRVSTKPTGPSMADQSQQKDTDIRMIMARFRSGQRVFPGSAHPLSYGDFFKRRRISGRSKSDQTGRSLLRPTSLSNPNGVRKRSG